MELRPVEFVWDRRDGRLVGKKSAGFIAQELAEAEDNHDAQWLGSVYRENPEKLEAAYAALIPVMVQAIQDLTNKVKELEDKLENQ